MDNIANTVAEQEGFWNFLSGLLGKLTNMEVFILTTIIILGFFAYKSWDKIKKIFTEREDTAVKRANEINNISISISEVRNEIKTYKTEHAIEHKYLEKDLFIIRESVKEIQRDLKGFGISVTKIHAKLDKFFSIARENA